VASRVGSSASSAWAGRIVVGASEVDIATSGKRRLIRSVTATPPGVE
jgi:hypothetical protein